MHSFLATLLWADPEILSVEKATKIDVEIKHLYKEMSHK